MPGTVLGAGDHISTISKVDKAHVSLSLYFSKKDKKIKFNQDAWKELGGKLKQSERESSCR